MAEIAQSNGRNQSQGKIRAKKQSTRIDMTPMADLAFLLLTFFILTATFTKNRAMDLTMPDNTGPSVPINENNILNLVLAKNNKIYWWIGLTPPAKETNFSKDGVRKVLLERSHANSRLMVLIKPSDDSRYENMVDILDEIKITNVEKYAIVNFTEEDKRILSGSAN